MGREKDEVGFGREWLLVNGPPHLMVRDRKERDEREERGGRRWKEEGERNKTGKEKVTGREVGAAYS